MRILAVTVTAVIAAVAGAGLIWWWLHAPAPEIAPRVPGQDIRSGDAAQEAPPVDLKGQFVPGEGSPADIAGTWPGLRGAKRDGVAHEPVRLAESWPESGPPALWSVSMGEGYAGAAVADGRVYVLDYDQDLRGDALRCLSLADGKEIWRRWYAVDIKRNHGISRTVPAVADGHVVTLGPKCHVLCVDAKTGDFRWGIDLVRQYGTKVPAWYAGQCPLIDDGRVILAPCGPDALLIAVDLKTGKPAWTTPNPGGWKMSHASIVVLRYGDRRVYVNCAEGGTIIGVAADSGEILFHARPWTLRYPIAVPIDVGEGKLLWAGGYGVGSLMLGISREGDGHKTDVLFRLKPGIFGATQQTPILHGGHLYGIRPDGQLTCLDLAGKTLWASGPRHTYGLGPLLIAGDRIYAMDDNGLLSMVRAAPDGFELLAQAKVLKGPDAWGPMAMVAGRLILRDLTRMVCLDVRELE